MTRKAGILKETFFPKVTECAMTKSFHSAAGFALSDMEAHGIPCLSLSSFQFLALLDLGVIAPNPYSRSLLYSLLLFFYFLPCLLAVFVVSSRTTLPCSLRINQLVSRVHSLPRWPPILLQLSIHLSVTPNFPPLYFSPYIAQIASPSSLLLFRGEHRTQKKQLHL